MMTTTTTENEIDTTLSSFATSSSPDVQKPDIITTLNLSDLIPKSLRLPPTEERNPKSDRLSSMPLKDTIRLFVNEESAAIKTLLDHVESMESLIEIIYTSMKSGGRLFYVGAGTSGRIGVMDASECYSTFSTDTVQAIIAGGIHAVHSPSDCSEETFSGGIAVVNERKVTRDDVIIGISASGTTPFLWGALYQSRLIGAYITLITFNPYLEFSPDLTPDKVIAVDVGPEIVTGSTRLKCGTTTKVLVNLVSTLTIGVRMGRTRDNLMINLHPSNSKLKQRALRIVMSLIERDDVLDSQESDRQPRNNETVIPERLALVQKVLKEQNYDVQGTLSHLMKLESP